MFAALETQRARALAPVSTPATHPLPATGPLSEPVTFWGMFKALQVRLDLTTAAYQEEAAASEALRKRVAEVLAASGVPLGGAPLKRQTTSALEQLLGDYRPTPEAGAASAPPPPRDTSTAREGRPAPPTPTGLPPAGPSRRNVLPGAPPSSTAPSTASSAASKLKASARAGKERVGRVMG